MIGLIVQAADKINNPFINSKVGSYTGIEFVQKLVQNLIKAGFVAASLFAFFMLILGAIRYITSGGDKAQTEHGRSQITTAIIGLVIVFSVYAIILLIGYFMGIDLMVFDIGALKLSNK